MSTEWTSKQWGSNGTLIGGTGTIIGDGSSNTTTVASWLDTNSEKDRAAQLCYDLTEGGYSDWFLPSKDELDKMYVNLQSGTDENLTDYTPVGDFTAFYYWSSSEISLNTAWALPFDGSSVAIYSKDNLTNVRAVRAF